MTRLEWFRTLNIENANRAIFNCGKQGLNILRDNCDDVYEALNGFSWADTREGHDYWADVALGYKSPFMLYIMDEIINNIEILEKRL